jgi:putative ABC transport system substrate-binding protein
LGQADRPNLVSAFRDGLWEGGYVDGRNVGIEYRFAENRHERLPALAADLAARDVAAIVATGGPNSVLAAKAATNSIPIVFTSGGDPVSAGFVSSLNQPGGNLTGISWFGAVVGDKVLGLLDEVVAKDALFILLLNPLNPESKQIRADIESAARALARPLLTIEARTPEEIDVAFEVLRQRSAGGLVVGGDPFFTSRRQQIVPLATQAAVPAIYFNREFVTEGGLMSYGNDPVDAFRRAGLYVARILDGVSPSNLPVDQATKFAFVINLKTAKALGIEVPTSLLVSADEVIE